MSSMSITNENDSIVIESPPQPNPVKHTKEDVSKPVGVVRINIVSAKNLNSWLDGDSLNFYVKITCSSSGFEFCKTHICNDINPEWNQEFYIPIYDIDKKFKIRVYNNNAFFNHVSLGFYILDPKDLIKGKKLDLERDLIKPKNRFLHIPPRPKKGKLRFVANFYSFSKYPKTTKFFKTTITLYNLCNLINYQCTDGNFELTDKLAKLFNFDSKNELEKAFTATIKDDEKVKSLHNDIWGTVLTTVLLKILYTNHVMWTNSFKEAEVYLKKIVTDTKQLYDLAENFANDHFKINEEEVLELSWASWIGEAIKSAIDVSQSTTKTKSKFEATKEFIENILIETTNNLTGKLLALIPRHKSTFKKTTVSDQEVKVAPINQCGEEIEITVPETQNNGEQSKMIENEEKPTIIVRKQKKKEKNVKKKAMTTVTKTNKVELTDIIYKVGSPSTTPTTATSTTATIIEMTDTLPVKSTNTVVVEHTTKKVIKEKADQVLIKKIQESVTEEEYIKVIKTQNEDGSFDISKQIADDLGITTNEDISSIICIADERVKELDTKVLITFLTLAYCNKVLCKYQQKFKAQNEKARSWLHTQVKDEKLEKELLEFCEKIVVERVSDIKKKEKFS
ncbi:hypothetical protein C1646_813031 [Rhizophagus diaphanus]|nr:hypothetical protein C1646_813031 [Rhizophagus diaphanus] [Rhizophagus sp. MUCL 43196]